MPMKISDIRAAIKAAGYIHADVGGGTPEERQRVGSRIAEAIDELRMLDIPDHFPADIESRNAEVQRCEQLLDRWKAGPGPCPTCPHGLGFNCRICWPQVKP
jgi:hypothetical protein